MRGSAELTLGIDLGTTFSSAAVHVGGRTHFVTDDRGRPYVPSVVHFPARGAPVVGTYALRLRQFAPTDTVSGIKRFLGRTVDATEVKVLQAQSAVDIDLSSRDLPMLRTRSGTYSPVEVASLIFRHLRYLAEKQFRSPIRKAVLTLPAAATLEVEHATVQAARAAGLEVLRTLSEPHAAALASEQRRTEQLLLVYDFGGGTLDVTVLRQSDARFVPLAIGGDDSLGGDDLDHAIAQLAAAHVWAGHQVKLNHDVVRWERLIHEAERTKIALSTRDVAPLLLPRAYARNGYEHDLDLLVHREDIEPRWSPLIQRSVAVTAKTLLAAGLRPYDVTTTLLVGGTTRLPSVCSAMERLMGTTVRRHRHPQIAVAEGAAIAAAHTLALAA